MPPMKNIDKLQMCVGCYNNFYNDLKTTMIYTHVATIGAGIISPADLLDISDPVGL